MQLVGFIVRIYHDAARSPERQVPQNSFVTRYT